MAELEKIGREVEALRREVRELRREASRLRAEFKAFIAAAVRDIEHIKRVLAGDRERSR